MPHFVTRVGSSGDVGAPLSLAVVGAPWRHWTCHIYRGTLACVSVYCARLDLAVVVVLFGRGKQCGCGELGCLVLVAYVRGAA